MECDASVAHQSVPGRWGGRIRVSPGWEEACMKECRVRCTCCGERFTVIRFERERTPLYCALCREERKREQTRERMRALRERQRRQ